jgi:hypothetical protein
MKEDEPYPRTSPVYPRQKTSFLNQWEAGLVDFNCFSPLIPVILCDEAAWYRDGPRYMSTSLGWARRSKSL